MKGFFMSEDLEDLSEKVDKLDDKVDALLNGAGADVFGNYPFFNQVDFWELVIRFGFNFLIAFIIVRLIYQPINKGRDYIFTFLVFNVVIFFVTYMLSDLKIKTGFAFGLFAVFSILRYRTEQIPIKEMTFLFVCIIVAVINALFSPKTSIAEVIFTNGFIILTTLVLEKNWVKYHLESKMIIYEKIENIKPENRELLLEDLKSRTGLPIERLVIVNVDFLKDVANIRVFYKESEYEQ